MDPFLRKLIRRLVFEPETMSRNQNFAAFERPRTKRALRVARHLRSIRDDLLAHPSVEFELTRHGESGRTWRLSFEDPETGARRRAFISDAEREILEEDPELAKLFRAATRDESAPRSFSS